MGQNTAPSQRLWITVGVGPLIAVLLMTAAARGQQLPIPQLALWESNMITYGQANCARLADPTIPFDQKLNPSTGHVYYDAERAFYQIADYTGNTAQWNSCAQIAEGIYRDQYVIPNNGDVYAGPYDPDPVVADTSGQGDWNFTTGLRMDYQRTADATSQYAVVLLSQNAAFARDSTPLAWTVTADLSREVAFAILSYINAEAVGQPPRQRRIDMVNQAYGHMKQWFVDFSWPGPWQQSPQTTIRLAPFMVGLTAHTLIRDWEQTHDSRLIPALRLAADWMWANAWIPRDASMWEDSRYRTAGAPDANLLIAPIYAFLYRQTGDTKYRDQGDQIFSGGVTGAWLGDGKHFDHNYWWSFDYVNWRTAGPVAPSPPAPPALPIANDGFESGTFSGGTGWSEPWTKSGDVSIRTSVDGPKEGKSHVRLRSSTGYLQRTVNLSGAQNVRLTFWAKVRSFESSDKALVRVSSDGVTFTTVKVFTSADGNNTYRYYDLDLTSFAMTATFSIAFDAEMSSTGDYWFIDNIQITGVRPPK